MALSSKSLAGLKGDYELSSEQPPQPGIHLRLPQEALVAIRRGETQLSFTDGQSPMLTVGSTEYRFQSSPENAPPEVYKLDRSSGSGQHAMHLIQTLQRRLRPDRSLDDPGVQDRIRQRSEQAKQVKDSQRTVMLNSSEVKGKGKSPTIQRSHSSSAVPSIHRTVSPSPGTGSKPRQPSRLVANHVPQRSASAQGSSQNPSPHPQYNYSIHAQRVAEKPAPQPPQQTQETSQAASDSSNSPGDHASSVAFSNVGTSSNTSISSADSPPAKAEMPPEQNSQMLTINPAWIMQAPQQQPPQQQQQQSSRASPQPEVSQVQVQSKTMSPPSATASAGKPAASSGGGGGGLMKGKETLKKEKKTSATTSSSKTSKQSGTNSEAERSAPSKKPSASNSKFTSAEFVEDSDDDAGDSYQPPSTQGGKRKASGASPSTDTQPAKKKPKPKPKPAESESMARTGSNSSSGKELPVRPSSSGPKTESRTAGGARVCGQPAKKAAAPAPSPPQPQSNDHTAAQKAQNGKTAAAAATSSSSQKRKSGQSTAATSSKKSRNIYYTSSEDEADEPVKAASATKQNNASEEKGDRGRAGNPKIIRTHVSQSSAAGQSGPSQSRASSKTGSTGAPPASKATTPAVLSRANSFASNATATNDPISFSGDIVDAESYTQAHKKVGLLHNQYEGRRQKLEGQRSILQRLIAGEELSEAERYQIPSKKEVGRLVEEANSARAELVDLQKRLWAYARAHQGSKRS